MVTIPGYQVIEALHESSRSRIYRGLRDTDQLPVILKILTPEYPSPAAIARFRMEYEILRSLDLAGVVKAYSLEPHQHSWMMAIEDFGGVSLRQLLQERKFTLEEFLTLAIRIAEILGAIHQQNIMHKDINPSNLVLNPTTGQVKIIDFGISTMLSRENPTLQNPNVLEGTLAYMSPEQTSRMNRAIDYRTDFYSLGVTFYQLLCDRLPFETTDAMELVHCHIAKQPLPPHQIASQAPEQASTLDQQYFSPGEENAVSSIVLKLLAKVAEDRYQSAWGIKADLQECLQQLQTTGKIHPFPLGRQDISGKFQIPQKLYGREQEIAALLAAFERVVESRGDKAETETTSLSSPSSSPSPLLPYAELILVTGYSGIGKSALVHELFKPITRQRGYFIAGKFDQLQRDTPYASLIQAFRGLIQQLLTEPEAQIAVWREKLLTALGTNGQIIVDVIPEVALIIGEQPAVLAMPPAESQNRFNLLLQNFIHVFTQPEHPLVIFLDDLQWSDRASLKLIQRLITASDSHSLLLIGAYRDNEVNAAHPLAVTLEEIQKAGVVVDHIALSPLNLTYVNQLIADTLHCELTQSLPLANLVIQKTHGNPFFMNEFLKSLHQEQCLNFEVESGQWQWDLAAIQAAQITDNVVELMIGKVQKLSVATQQSLKLAACIGNQFDLATLSIVSEKPPSQVAKDLWEAMQAGLVFALGDAYKYLLAQQSDNPEHRFSNPIHSSEITIHSAESHSYKFSHDRVQQATYSLISESDQKSIHLKVGQLLLQSTPAELVEEKIFEMIHHLNLGLELITDQAQKDTVAQLNLIAGRRAKAAVAYDTAAKCLAFGRELLSTNPWSQNYDLTLALYNASVEAAYLQGDFVQMAPLIDEVLRHAKTPLDQVPAYQTQIQAYIAQNQMAEAIAVALQVLSSLEVNIPLHPSSSDLAQAHAQAKQALAEQPVDHLLHLPPMTDPQKLAAMQTIACVCTPTYFTAPDLWQLMVFQKIQLSLHYGNAPGSAFGYADYGMVLCGVEENLDAGYQFAQLASNLLPQLNAKQFVPKTLLLVNIYLRHWKEHLKESLDPLLEAYQQGLETGDLEYATAAIAFRFYHAYLVGKALPELNQEMASYEEAIVQFNRSRALEMTHLYRQAILNLMGRSAHPCHLVGEIYNEVESLPQHLASNDKGTIFHLYLNKLILHYLFQDYPQAAQDAATLEQLLAAGAIGLLVVPVVYFYNSLTNLAIFPQATPSEQQRILSQVAANQQKMQTWATHAPMNYQHKFHLVQAEQHRILGEPAAAMDEYDRAIALAQEHGYLQEEALAQELAAKFYLERGKTKIAQVYLLDARYAYQQWGAAAKVKDLEQRYPQVMEHRAELMRSSTRSKPGSSSPTASSSTGSAMLDLVTVMKAAQTLSGEIVLEQLLAKLMRILLENAGAERGYLILETQGKLLIEAEGIARDECVTVLQSLPIEHGNCQLSTGIINYVVRTHESVVLNDATQESKFSQDPYIIQQQPKSVLCAPLVHQGKLSGILYVENNLTVDAFTPERLEVLKLLSSQAAIAIENARLYNQLELRVEERTVELSRANQQLQENERQILQALEKERELNSLKSKFVSMVSHEFRNPMTTIGGCAKALQNPNRHLSESQKASYFKLIQESIADMLRLLDEVLLLGRTEAGGLQYNPKPLYLEQFCLELIEPLRLSANNQQTIVFTYQGADKTVEMDATLMRHIFTNLISNAIKYSPQGGQICFEVSWEGGGKESGVRSQELGDSNTPLASNPQPGVAIFRIQDQGIGIPLKDQERLFETFHRSSNVGEIQGTGLGLAIVKRCVDLHRGQIHLESEVNVGTTVIVQLPVTT